MPGPGMDYTEIRVPKFLGFYAGQAGGAYNAGTSTRFGLRENATLTLKTQNVKDSNERDIRNADDVEFIAVLLQTDMSAIQTLMGLSRGYHSLWLPSAFGDFYQFVDNTGGPSAPNGSALVGLHWKLTIEKDKRSLEAKWGTRLFKTEWAWMRSNMAALSAGGSGGGGGALSGVSTQTYNRTKFRESNFTDITMGGTSIGAFGDAKLEIESAPVFTDNRNREIGGYVNVKGEATMGQSSASALLDIWTSAETDETISYFTPAGEEFRCVNGAVTTSPEHMHSEKEANVKVMFNGQIPYSLVTFPSADLMSMNFTS